MGINSPTRWVESVRTSPKNKFSRMTTNCRSFGQPLLNTRNDLRTGLVNGDTGIVVNTKTGRKVVFSTQQQSFEPSALEDIEVAFATTIHKSQGSEYHTVIVVVPPVGSPLLRRELLYTAVTRARKHLVLIASEDAITSAVMSTIKRASGLAARVRD